MLKKPYLGGSIPKCNDFIIEKDSDCSKEASRVVDTAVFTNEMKEREIMDMRRGPSKIG